TAPTAVDVPAVAMPLDLGLRKIGHDVVFVLAGRFEITGPAMGTLLRGDIVFDEDGAGWGLRPKAAGVLTVFLAPAGGGGGVGGIAARDGASAALVDGLQLVLDLRQPAAQLRVLRLQVVDPLLEGGNEGQDGGLGLGRDRVPERCGDRRWRNHTLDYDVFVQKVRSEDASATRIQRRSA